MSRPFQTSLSLLTALVLTISIGAQARAGLFLNGDFSTSVPSNGTGGDWITSDNWAGWSGSGGNPGGTFLLNANGASDTPGRDPTISQEVSNLTKDSEYLITGQYKLSINYDNDTEKSFGVLVDGIPIQEFITPTSYAWTNFSASFSAPTTGDVTIGFAAEMNGTDASYFVDNLSLDLAPASNAVPEPSSLAILGSGLLGLVTLASRRSRRRGKPV